MSAKVTVIDHPLIQHKLTLMRQTQTSTAKFRQLLKEIGMLLAYEVTRDLPLKYEQIETPIAKMNAPVLAASKKIVIISIMRAGQGLLDSILELIPSARGRTYWFVPGSDNSDGDRILFQSSPGYRTARCFNCRSDAGYW